MASDLGPVKRVVACVDGTWYDDNGCCNTRFGNNSNIFRLWASVKQGTFVHGSRSVKQVALYESGTGVAKHPVDSFNDAVTTDGSAGQIDKILEYCSSQLSDSSDELWLYGFSRGAYVVQAVADLIHEFSQSATQSQEQFVQLVQKLPAVRRDSAAKLFAFLAGKARTGQPAIRFLGLFDTMKVSQPKHDASFYKSVGDIRHALALAENRRAFQPSLYGPFDITEECMGRSVVEAWFVGSHADIGGGSRDDGLSLYPLQWIMLESVKKGLILDDKSQERNGTIKEDPYGLVFPSAPQAENEAAKEIKPWEFRYTNGIELKMVDLRRSHKHGNIKTSKGNVLKKKPKLSKAQSKTAEPPAQKEKEKAKDKDKEKDKEKRKSGFKGLFSRKNKSNDSVTTPPPETPTEVSLVPPEDLGPRPHTVQINPGAALRTLMSGDRAVFKNNKLIGYRGDAPCGIIIHPSVYFVIDLYNRLGIGDSIAPFFDGLDTFRKTAFMKRGREKLDPWIAESDFGALGRGTLKDCRVLVCGRAGVGKSTLINKVFGVPVTQASNDDHGIHDIDEGFARDTFPGLIVHDSRGFQSGATQEVELLERFVKKRSSEADPSERLDAIWLCIDVPSTRTVHEADRKIFEVLDNYARSVPIVIVRTMKDRFINEHLSMARQDLREAGVRGDELDRQSEEKAEEAFAKVQEEDINRLERSLNLAKDFAPFVYVSHRDPASIRELVKKTISLVPDDGACLNLVAAQLVDVDEKINAAIEESVRLLNISNYTAMAGSSLVFGATIATPTISNVLCENVVKCFGLTDLKAEEIEKLADHVLWSNLGTFLRQNLTQTIALWGTAAGLTVASGFGGIPFLMGIPFASVPPAARMIMKCASDIILILVAVFDQKGKLVLKDDFEEASKQYASKTPGANLSIRTRVHRDVDYLIPTWTYKLHQAMKVSNMRIELRRIIREHRFAMDGPKAEESKESEELGQQGTQMNDLQQLRDWKTDEAATELPDANTSLQSLDEWKGPETVDRQELHAETAQPPEYSAIDMLTENKVLINDPALRGGRLQQQQQQQQQGLPTRAAELPGTSVRQIGGPVELGTGSIRRKAVPSSSSAAVPRPELP